MKLIQKAAIVFSCLLFIHSTANCSTRERRKELSNSKASGLVNADLVNKFYERTHSASFWFSSDSTAVSKRSAFISVVNAADSIGLTPGLYHDLALNNLSAWPPANEKDMTSADRLLTDAAIAFFKAVYQGENMQKWLSYDGISQKYATLDNDFVIQSLQQTKSGADILKLLQELQPKSLDYRLLKSELRDCVLDTQILRVKRLKSSMNYYRWITHFKLDSFIVINIGSATLKYIRRDSALLSMKTVVGTEDSRTPRFAAYCKEVTLYPYWNIPHSITVNEWLSMFKRKPSLLSKLHMQVIDNRGRIVDPNTINWESVGRANFPYRIREESGCLNPMGVIKFALTSPYDVYMHDTNFKGAFLSKNRYYSHGCIRLEDPVALANALLPEPVDTSFLNACYENQTPQLKQVMSPVPVFIVYMTAEVVQGTVVYYKDIYHLLK